MENSYGDIDQILKGLRSRDQEALRALYKSHGGAINGIISRMITDPNIAKEALQDCFLRIWQKIELYDKTKGRLFTWMAQIARNIARDKLKSKENNKRSKTDSIENIVGINESSELSVTMKDEDIGVRGLKDLLRKEEGIIIDYLYFKGYNQRELSEKLDIPIGTIKTRLRMAISNLRKHLQ